MQISKHKRKTTTEMNITPMIDIVFLLLIFFITVSQISELKQEPVRLPELEGAQDQKPSTLTINIDAAGTIVVTGKPMTIPQLMIQVANELELVDNDTGRLTVVIRQDRAGTAKTVNRILTQLKDLGVGKIKLAVQKS